MTDRIELADTSLQIVGWAETLVGELYLLDQENTNQVYHLVRREVDDQSNEFPRNLGKTGLFSSVADHEPAPGVVPYFVVPEKAVSRRHLT